MTADRDPTMQGENRLKDAIKPYLTDGEELKNYALAVSVRFWEQYLVALTDRRLLLLRKRAFGDSIKVHGIRAEYLLPSLPPVDVSIGPFSLSLKIRDSQTPFRLRFSLIGVVGIPDLDNRRQAFAIAGAFGVSQERLSEPQNAVLDLVAEFFSLAISKMRPVEHKPLGAFLVLLIFLLGFPVPGATPLLTASRWAVIVCAFAVLLYRKRWAVIALSAFWVLGFLIGLVANAPSLPVFFQLVLLAVFWAVVFPTWESFD